MSLRLSTINFALIFLTLSISNCYLEQVVCEPQFLNDPHGAAISVANKFESPSNGAIMRTSILGVAHFYDLNEVATNAVRICKATHTDPRLARFRCNHRLFVFSRGTKILDSLDCLFN